MTEKQEPEEPSPALKLTARTNTGIVKLQLEHAREMARLKQLSKMSDYTFWVMVGIGSAALIAAAVDPKSSFEKLFGFFCFVAGRYFGLLDQVGKK